MLSSWIRFDGKSIKPAPQTDGDPRVAGTYNSQYRAETRRRAPRHVDVPHRGRRSSKSAPTATSTSKANRTIQNNEERWRIFLSGEVRREAIQPDRTVTSDAIVNLDIVKKEEGQVRDGYARGWFAKWYDKYKPF